MPHHPSHPSYFKSLRKRAEAEQARAPEQIPNLPLSEVHRLVHELKTHQIELEIQNEELLQAQVELIESRDKYSDLYDFAPSGYCTLSPAGIILEANLTAAEMLETERARLSGCPFSKFVDSGSQDTFYRHLNQVLAIATQHVCELQLAGTREDALYVQLRTRPTKDEANQVASLRTAITDITQQKRATDELAQHRDHLDDMVMQRTAELEKVNQHLRREIDVRMRAEEAILQEQRQLRRLLDTQERDRRLAAYEIHDGFIQPLAAAKMFFECQLRLLREQLDPAARDGFEQGLRLLNQSIDEARRLISLQRPMVLDDSGLLLAIDYLVAAVAKQGDMEIEYSRDVQFERLPAPLETAIFRIIQEGLANTQHYSQSDRVRLALIQREELVRVEIEDWGIGFDPSGVPESHFGLEGMRQRARLFGGHIAVDSAPGKGTRITVEMPVLNGDERS